MSPEARLMVETITSRIAQARPGGQDDPHDLGLAYSVTRVERWDGESEGYGSCGVLGCEDCT